MNLQFNNVTLHNFASYQTASVDLRDRGFCLVTGRNNCKKDNALSNGSGKSFLWSAICFALTGETIGGLKSGLVNINPSDDDSYVILEFVADGVEYKIKRILAPKSDMKIIRDGSDESGKGIKESEKKLAEFLPDLNKDLIASTIIIGQGMPNKFSSFSPSGRKELLEKLTKSDFMIEDIKSRISERMVALSGELRSYDDAILVNNTKLKTLTNNEAACLEAINNFPVIDYDKELAAKQITIANLNADILKLDEDVATAETAIDATNAQLLAKTAAKADEVNQLNQSFNEGYNAVYVKKLEADSLVNQLKREIQRLESIKDVCPTCGQPLKGVVKPDTAEQKKALAEALAKQAELAAKLTEFLNKKAGYASDISMKFDGEIKTLNESLSARKISLAKLKSSRASTTNIRDEETKACNKLAYDKATHDKTLADLKTNLTAIRGDINQLTNATQTLQSGKDACNEHIAVVKKMETLAKRDFRGFLLADVIAYLDAKAKEYCMVVFGTDELNVYLDGNALDISYCGKMFDNLSGGEKQRVDLILQFAIRDMMSAYLGYSSNILALDEITDFLDKQSCDAVINLISDKLTDIESLFIISHHADELNLPVDSELHVVKDEDGVSSVQDN